MLFSLQHKLIYHPRPYDAPYTSFLQQPRLELLSYSTSQGQQIAFYLPPRKTNTGLPKEIWMLFGGNGSLALDWSDLIVAYPDADTSFLLLDYPGYGQCEGSASPQAIQESAEKAWIRLASHLKTETGQLESRLNVMGHSLGAATGLQFAVQHTVKRMILISPFTTLEDMAQLVVGSWLSRLLMHHYDNRARLQELLTQPTAISIIHGDRDEVVPVAMGRELSRLAPQRITYHEIPQGDHNALIFYSQPLIFKTMQAR